MAVLVGLQVILNRFINVSLGSYLRINFGFLPNALAGALMGPFCGLLTGALGDFLGAMLFPEGAYFPGFTLTAALAGLNYGLWLYCKKDSLSRIALCLLPVTLLGNILLNTLWLYLLSGASILANFPLRVLKNLAQYPLNVVLLYASLRLIRRLPATLTQL